MTAAVESTRVQVVVADDSVLLRDGLCRLLEDGGFEVIGRAGDADGLLAGLGESARRRHHRHPDAADAHR